MRHPLRTSCASLALSFLCSAPLTAFAPSVVHSQSPAPTLSAVDRARGRVMLRAVREDVEKYYYDSTFHGIDVKSRFAAADERIARASSNGELFGTIAQLLAEFDDSHTFFWPPERAAKVDYGWRIQAVGDSVFVAAVKPGSDAAAQGVAPGDRVVLVQGYAPTRANLWQLQYLLSVLRPQTQVRATLRKPDGTERTLTIGAVVTPGVQRLDPTLDEHVRAVRAEYDEYVRLHRDRERVVDGDVFVWRMGEFRDADGDVDAQVRKVARHGALVLDLRGNPGGRLSTLRRLVGHFFDRRVLVETARTRKGVDSSWAQPSGAPFGGRLVILLDSRSASAAELFARVMQIEARGTVVGDWSAGAVMGAYHFPHVAGVGRLVSFGVSVTAMDIRTADGASLEKHGVMPDEFVLPSAADLAAGRDPALARAVAIAGGKLTPEQGGALFPTEWLP